MNNTTLDLPGSSGLGLSGHTVDVRNLLVPDFSTNGRRTQRSSGRQSSFAHVLSLSFFLVFSGPLMRKFD